MAKVTSKLQVTVPKAIADQYAIRPGDDIDWIPAGDAIRVIPAHRPPEVDEHNARLGWFDQATQRHRKRHRARKAPEQQRDRGWKREGLYGRGRSR